eukprot:g6173.t1
MSASATTIVELDAGTGNQNSVIGVTVGMEPANPSQDTFYIPSAIVVEELDLIVKTLGGRELSLRVPNTSSWHAVVTAAIAKKPSLANTQNAYTIIYKGKRLCTNDRRPLGRIGIRSGETLFLAYQPTSARMSRSTDFPKAASSLNTREDRSSARIEEKGKATVSSVRRRRGKVLVRCPTTGEPGMKVSFNVPEIGRFKTRVPNGVDPGGMFSITIPDRIFEKSEKQKRER